MKNSRAIDYDYIAKNISSLSQICVRVYKENSELCSYDPSGFPVDPCTPYIQTLLKINGCVNYYISPFEHFYGIVNFISDKWNDEAMYLYLGKDFEGNLCKNCDEGELRWIDKSEIMKLPMWEGDVYFLREMLLGADKISMTLRYEGDTLKEIIL